FVSLSGAEDFPQGGYYILRDAGTLTFLRCGHYKDRPFQADNLHLDIWVDSQNIMRDAGSYLYNTDERWTRYFAGTASHNTVILGDYDQMRKGPRFIWYDWIRESRASWLNSKKDEFVFEGQFTGFRQVGRNIVHRRRVTKEAGKLAWLVEDWLENAPPELPMHQTWHPGEGFFENFSMKSFDELGQEIVPTETEGWYSEKYGQKVKVVRLVFTIAGRYLRTTIESKKNDSR
ncbi:heparinase II/III-family protein, partial [Persicitalea sp.]|uniref:heparinase II/III family protein n=1 Tax=Persicitalea sp. TaxID=3100273 RepID=UPI003593B447